MHPGEAPGAQAHGVSRTELIGGPFDGAWLPTTLRVFVWVAGSAKPRGFAKPGNARSMYRLAGSQYLYSELTHAFCEGCGGVSERPAESCRLCGCALGTGAASL